MTKISGSVVIPTCNRHIEIINVLKSIKNQTVQPDEIIIVDSSDYPLEENIEFKKYFNLNFFPAVKLIYNYSHKKGAALQRNIGINIAACDIIHFIDDDMRLNNDYIEQMNKVFLTRPEYGGGMGTIESLGIKNFNFHRFLRIIFLLQRDNSSGYFTGSGMPTHPYGKLDFRNVHVLNGCASYRSCVIKELLFDEKLGAYSYMEDCDLSKRASKKYCLFFNPEAKMEHLISNNNRANIIEVKAIFIRNYSYIFFKNFYPENKLRIFAYIWSIFGLFAEAVIYRKWNHVKGYYYGLKSFCSGF